MPSLTVEAVDSLQTLFRAPDPWFRVKARFFPSVTVAAVDALQTLFRAPLTPGVHTGGRNIAYYLALVKLGPHTKFGEDWSNGLAVHWIHTDRQTT